ncbi:unnamed protein product [Chrysoparadoxa australica]
METAERDRNGMTALLRAALVGCEEAVRELLALGADFEAHTERGSRPLHLAAGQGHLGCVIALLEAGASIDARGQYYDRAVDMASSNGHLDVVQELIRRGAALSSPAEYAGKGPLSLAASRGHQEVCLALIGAGANGLSGDERGMTVLHHAAVEGLQTVVNALLKRGADPDCMTAEGRTVAGHCQYAWRRFGQYNFPEAQKISLLNTLSKASKHNALWRGRKLILMLQARLTAGEDIRASAASSTGAETEQQGDSKLEEVRLQALHPTWQANYSNSFRILKKGY